MSSSKPHKSTYEKSDEESIGAYFELDWYTQPNMSDAQMYSVIGLLATAWWIMLALNYEINWPLPDNSDRLELVNFPLYAILLVWIFSDVSAVLVQAKLSRLFPLLYGAATAIGAVLLIIGGGPVTPTLSAHDLERWRLTGGGLIWGISLLKGFTHFIRVHRARKNRTLESWIAKCPDQAMYFHHLYKLTCYSVSDPVTAFFIFLGLNTTFGLAYLNGTLIGGINLCGQANICSLHWVYSGLYFALTIMLYATIKGGWTWVRVHKKTYDGTMYLDLIPIPLSIIGSVFLVNGVYTKTQWQSITGESLIGAVWIWFVLIEIVRVMGCCHKSSTQGSYEQRPFVNKPASSTEITVTSVTKKYTATSVDGL